MKGLFTRYRDSGTGASTFSESLPPSTPPRVRQRRGSPETEQVPSTVDVETDLMQKAANGTEHQAPPSAPAAASSLAGLSKALKRPWAGHLVGLVASNLQAELAVLNLGCGDVALVGTEEALASSHSKTVKTKIEEVWHFQVVCELHVSKVAMGALNERLSSSIGLALEDRHLAVYDDMVRAAIQAKASDIHITTDKASRSANIQLRIYGKIKHWRTNRDQLIVDAIAAAFGKRVKASTNTREQFSSETESAFMTQQLVQGVQWEGRFNGRPYITGYAGVMRMLESDPKIESIPDLKQLGYSKSHIELITPAVERNYGLIIIFGSTGSGKSTTLRTFMVKVTDPSSMKVYTAENPAEYVMPGIVQFSLPVDVNLESAVIQQKFTSLLRDLMRMDPDALMVGEVRDYETGRMTAEFTQTGHRCYTTAHGEGCVDGLSRLCGGEIRMPPDTLAGSKFLSASLYQRLLPKLCHHCKLPANHPEHGLSARKQALLRSKFDLDPGSMFVANPEGCSHCQPDVTGLKGNGTQGVTVAVEVLLPTAEMRSCIARRDWPGLDQLWRAQRVAGYGESDMLGKTAFEHAIWLVSQGVVSLKDVEAEFEPIEAYEVRGQKAIATSIRSIA